MENEYDDVWEDDWEHYDFKGYERDPDGESDELNNE